MTDTLLVMTDTLLVMIDTLLPSVTLFLSTRENVLSTAKFIVNILWAKKPGNLLGVMTVREYENCDEL
jgi:hypothetical protein